MKSKRVNRKPVQRTTQRTSSCLTDDDLKGVSGAGTALNYNHVEWTYTQQKRPGGSGGGNVAAKYDLVKAKGA